MKTEMCLLAGDVHDTWEGYASIVATWGIEDADASGFTIRSPTESVSITFPDGLTEHHVRYFAPMLSSEDNDVLVLGVLRNRLQPFKGWEQVLLRAYGINVLDVLPTLVKSRGVDAVVEWIRQKVCAYRSKHTTARIQVAVTRLPTWDADASVLSFGGKHWRIRKQEGPLRELLNDLERRHWPSSVRLAHLDPDQVRDVAMALRKKTSPEIGWRASSDSTLAWSAGQT